MVSAGKCQRVLIIVENLPVPFDRRVWLEATALRNAGYQVSIICPTGRGYEDLNISDGQAASVAFLVAMYGNIPEVDRVKVVSDLEQYCGRDTEGMIWIVDKLRELINH